MDTEVTEMKQKIARIRKHADDFAKTPEGRELAHRMMFATNLLKTLKAEKMTQADFCRKINMKSSQLSRIAQGDENITMAMITRIADGLGVHPDKLFKEPRKSREPAGASV